MSYSRELKRQLAEKDIKRNCCRRSLLYGMLSMRGVAVGDEVTLSLDAGAAADLASAEIRRLFGIVPSAVLLGPKRGRARLVFTSPLAAAYIRSAELTYPEKVPPCPHCLSHFLRGIFIAAGRMSDFTKLYRLEFSCGERREELLSLLSEITDPPKRTERKGESLLYYKTNSAICDLLAFIGAESSAFALINDNIEAGYRNAANRRANCEARNIEKSVEASMRFVHIVRRLEAADMLTRLPDELRETAMLRAENPTASLAALGNRCSPPVSKSGMNHRLEKIERLAAELLAEEEG